MAQFYLDDFTRGHLIPRLVTTPCVRIPVYVSFFRAPRYTRLSTTVVYVVGAMTPAKSTMLLLSLTDNHVIDAWVHIPPERFYPYSLLSRSSIRTTNRTSFLVFLWYSTKPYAPIAYTRTLWCLPRQNCVSTVHAYSSFVPSNREALTFTGLRPQTYCVVSGAYVPKVVLEVGRTAYVLDVWTASPP